MAKPGRKRTPTPVLKLRGSWRAKDRQDVKVKSGLPQRPYGLEAGAKRHWNKIVPQLAEMGILAEADWPKLEQMYIIYSKMQQFEPGAKSPVIKTAKGTFEDNKIYYAWLKLNEKYDKLSSQFCIGPTNRAGMGGVQQKQKDDEKARFFRENSW